MTQSEPNLTSPDVPLVVDLDGTLSRTDTLHEALLAILSSRPLDALALIGKLSEGRPAVKQFVADRQIMGADELPLNEAVLKAVQEAVASGREVHLVSAADHRQTTKISEETGLFSSAVGTGGPETVGMNLKAENKARYLIDRFGEGGFDYIGDAPADIPVWKAARQAITVDAAPALRRAAEAANARTMHISEPSDTAHRARQVLKAMRVRQWVKNLLVFLPLAAAHEYSAIGHAIIAFLAFSLTASSVYLVNDLLDLRADRAHPRKRKRPFARGDVPLATGVLIAIALLAAAFAVSLALPASFLAVLACYFVATTAYSFSLKRKLIVDVLTLALLYTLRIIAGAAATEIPLSAWMLGFSMFVFLSLAAVKRQAELVDLAQSGKEEAAGRAYQASDAPIMSGTALSAAHAAILVLALYITGAEVVTLYSQPQVLWLLCPILLYWLLRMIIKAHRGMMTDDPIEFAARDPVSILTLMASAAVMIAATVF